MVPELKTDRLHLRPWTMDDVAAAFVLYGDPRVTRYIGGQTAADLSEMADQLAARIEKTNRYPDGYGAWAAELEGTVVGCGLVKPLPDRDEQPTDDIEVGWHLAHHVWGHGLATELGCRLVRYGIDDLGLDDLHAVVEPANEASKRVAVRVGLTLVGRTDRYYGGLVVDHFRLRQ